LPFIEFCRNCRNFVERRDIEGFAACVRNHRPRIACDDFKPRSDVPESARKGLSFCLYCENLVIVKGFAACVRNHKPRIACDDFRGAVRTSRKEASTKRLSMASLLTSLG